VPYLHEKILFGSYARGKENADSDLDLLIIQDTPFVPENSRLKEMGMLLAPVGGHKNPKGYFDLHPDEVARWKSSLNHIIPTALREGIVLYER